MWPLLPVREKILTVPWLLAASSVCALGRQQTAEMNPLSLCMGEGDRPGGTCERGAATQGCATMRRRSNACFLLTKGNMGWALAQGLALAPAPAPPACPGTCASVPSSPCAEKDCCATGLESAL